MRLPLKESGTAKDIDKLQAQEMVDYAYAHGVNYFDTAWMYHDEFSEPFIGEALSKYDRKTFNLATKLPLMFLKTEADVERFFNAQIEKCKVDYFDFYLLHNICESHLEIAERCRAYEQIKEKQKQGKIRHFGFSFHDRPELLEKVLDKYEFDFVQIQLNYMDWEQQRAQEQYKILSERGIPVIVMEPVHGGALAKLSPGALDVFKAADPNASPASWALRFAATLLGVMTVLSGMSTPDQMHDNIATFEHFKSLTAEDYKVIDNALAAYRVSGTVPCTNCRYCMDCPAGVDIPKALAIYNTYLREKAEKHPMVDMHFDMQYRILGEDHQAKHCVKCNQCAERCPQHIEIPCWMDVINELNEQRQKAAGK
jgi:predicted aldo/keto reductase-like oxidoreductase